MIHHTPLSVHPRYLDFDVDVHADADGSYSVAVRSAAGETRTSTRFPFDTLALENRLLSLENALLRGAAQHRQVRSPQETTVQQFGQVLFETLMVGHVRALYAASRLLADQQQRGLRLRLHIQPPEMALLPWEFMYDPEQDDYLCLDARTPIVRYVDINHPPQPLRVTLPLRILVMIASPQALPPLDVDLEKQRIEQSVAPLVATGQVEVAWVQGETWRDLQRAMRTEDGHVFHFIGHGGFDRAADEGFLALADDEGDVFPFMASQLARLLTGHPTLRLAVLNACEGGRGGKRDTVSSVAAKLAQRGLPAVVAMQYPITDRAAIEFTRAFYESVVRGRAIDEAVLDGRLAIGFAAARTVEWGVPMLYLRATDSLLFTISPPARVVKPGPGPKPAIIPPGPVSPLPNAAQALVQAILNTIPREPVSNIIDRVFLAIEQEPQWKEQYQQLVAARGPSGTHPKIAHYVRTLTGLGNLGTHQSATSTLIKSYTELG